VDIYANLRHEFWSAKESEDFKKIYT